MFRLLLKDRAIVCAASQDGRACFKGKDVARLCGYKSVEYFLKRHCEKTLEQLALWPEQCAPEELKEKYLGYDELLHKKRNRYQTEDWESLKKLPILKVNVYDFLDNTMPAVRVDEEEGVWLFISWFHHQYKIPRPKSPGYTPASPKYTPNSPEYSPPSPPFPGTVPIYSPHSPEYSPRSPDNAVPDSSTLRQPPIYYSSPGSSPTLPSMSPIIRNNNTSSSSSSIFLFFDAFPPSTIKFCYQGNLQVFEKKDSTFSSS